MCLDVLDPADLGRSDICSLRRLIYSAAVGMASLASTLRFRPPSPGGPTLQQPHCVTSLVSTLREVLGRRWRWQHLQIFFPNAKIIFQRRVHGAGGSVGEMAEESE